MSVLISCAAFDRFPSSWSQLEWIATIVPCTYIQNRRLLWPDLLDLHVRGYLAHDSNVNQGEVEVLRNAYNVLIKTSVLVLKFSARLDTFDNFIKKQSVYYV